MQYMGLGLELMVVGMLTVFVILLIVIYGGKLMIAVCNKIFPAEEPVRRKNRSDDLATVRPVLDAAVSELTGGKGHITSIKKL